MYHWFLAVLGDNISVVNLRKFEWRLGEITKHWVIDIIYRFFININIGAGANLVMLSLQSDRNQREIYTQNAHYSYPCRGIHPAPSSNVLNEYKSNKGRGDTERPECAKSYGSVCIPVAPELSKIAMFNRPPDGRKEDANDITKIRKATVSGRQNAARAGSIYTPPPTNLP